MIFTLKLMTWTCKEPLMITQVVKIHQRTLNKHWGYVHTNPGIFGNAFFIPICDRSPGKQFPNNSVSVSGFFRELKQRAGRWRRQREQETSKKVQISKTTTFMCITLVRTFLCRRCTTTTWKYIISRFVEDLNTRQRFSFSLPELRSMQSFRIHLQKKSPTFVGLNEVK